MNDSRNRDNVGLYVKDTSNIKFIVERIKEIPNVTVAHITTGKFNVFCKIRAKGTTNAKNIKMIV